jgi:hypothetical protein
MSNFDCKDDSKQVTDTAKDDIESDSADDAESADDSRERYYNGIYEEVRRKGRQAFVWNKFDSAISDFLNSVKYCSWY